MGTTILTFIVVAPENILAGEVDTFIWRTNITIESDDGGHGKTRGNCSKLVTVGRTNHFTLVEINKYESPLDRTYHEWAKILIEYQYPIIHGMKYNSNPCFTQDRDVTESAV